MKYMKTTEAFQFHVHKEVCKNYPPHVLRNAGVEPGIP